MNKIGQSSNLFTPQAVQQSQQQHQSSASPSRVNIPPFSMSRDGYINMQSHDILASLCQLNDITYIGDTHGQLGIPYFVSESVHKLKAAGVQMAGVEFVKYSQNAAFQQALTQGEQTVKDFLNNDWGKHGYQWTGKVAKALCDLHRAGIKVVGIDRAIAGPEPKNLRESMIYMNKRLALNVAWDAALSKELNSAGMTKSIICGGLGHFKTGDSRGPKDMRSGPIMAFAHEGDSSAPPLGMSRLNTMNAPLVITTINKS